MAETENRKTARELAEDVANAYEVDIRTGLAPGLTLADIIEVALDERDEAADASVAALREALESDAGAALLERLRKAEAGWRYWRKRLFSVIDMLRDEGQDEEVMGDVIRRVLAERDGLRAKVATLETALRGMLDAWGKYAEWHGPSAEHHRDDCPDDDCRGCEIDEATDAAVAAAHAALEVKS